MKTKALGQGIVCLVVTVMAASVTADEARPTIDIAAGHPGAALSPMLFGGFLEHMFTCIEGGLWGELLEDRKFAGNVAGPAVLPTPWEVSFAPADAGRLSLEPPRHGDLPGDRAHSLKIVLPSDKPAVARITAPIFVSAKSSYQLTVWLRQETGSGHMRVWLESKTGVQELTGRLCGLWMHVEYDTSRRTSRGRDAAWPD